MAQGLSATRKELKFRARMAAPVSIPYTGNLRQSTEPGNVTVVLKTTSDGFTQQIVKVQTGFLFWDFRGWFKKNLLSFIESRLKIIRGP